MSLGVATWQRSSLTLVAGTSLDDPAISPAYLLFSEFARDTIAHYRSPAGTNGMVGRATYSANNDAVPSFTFKGVNGSTVAQIATRMATDIALMPWTHVLIDAGTNQRGIARDVSQNDTVTMLNNATASNTNNKIVVVVTPYAWGESTPSGTNGGVAGNDDTALDNYDLDAEIIAKGGTTGGVGVGSGVTFPGYANVVVVPMRRILFAGTIAYSDVTSLATINAGGAGTNPYTTPDASQAHLNPRGRRQWTNALKHYTAWA